MLTTTLAVVACAYAMSQEQPDDVSGSRTGSSHEADQLVLLPAVVPATVDDTTLADVPHKAVVEVANDTSSASVDSTADKSEHSAAADKNTGTDSADVDTDVVTDVNTDMNTNVHDSEQPARDSPQQQQQQQQQDHSDTATAVAVTGSHELAETLDSSEEQLQELTLQEQPLHQNDDVDATSETGESLVDENASIIAEIELPSVAVVAVDSGSGELQVVSEGGSGMSTDSSATDGESATSFEPVTAVTEDNPSITDDNTRLEVATIDDSTDTSGADNDGATADTAAGAKPVSETEVDTDSLADSVAAAAAAVADTNTDTSANQDEAAAATSAVDVSDKQNDAIDAAATPIDNATAANMTIAGAADSTGAATDAVVDSTGSTAAGADVSIVKEAVPEPVAVEVRASLTMSDVPQLKLLYRASVRCHYLLPYAAQAHVQRFSRLCL
eukprot:960-Heterococcus_DN1.PRE.1